MASQVYLRTFNGAIEVSRNFIHMSYFGAKIQTFEKLAMQDVDFCYRRENSNETFFGDFQFIVIFHIQHREIFFFQIIQIYFFLCCLAEIP